MTLPRRSHPRPLDIKNGRIDMTHGGGGRAMAQLVEEMFVASFDNPALNQGDDQGIIHIPGGRLAVSTDGYVINPLFFPGGDIGSLAVHGTVNDVAMSGAAPISLTAGFIIEEGFPLADLARIVQSMAEASRQAGVPIITGDTKVVEKGKGDGVFITTAGMGLVPPGLNISGANARPGDVILISGSMGDHGVAVMSKRESLGFETEILSDSAALHKMIAAMVAACPGIRVLRDPTRGGLAATLNEIAAQSGVGMLIHEDQVPVKPQVKGACELLGLDPLYVANEGKLICICPPEDAARLLEIMRADPLGADAVQIGACDEDSHHFVRMQTAMGGTRIVDWLAGEQLPRIC